MEGEKKVIPEVTDAEDDDSTEVLARFAREAGKIILPALEKGMNKQPYRNLALVTPTYGFVEPFKVQEGPSPNCPYCGWEKTIPSVLPSQYLHKNVRACQGRHWLWRLFGACSRRDHHLHQWCSNCGGRWMCNPKRRLLP